ncbi:MAG: CDP-alcohol phosphatidyltransferase family protein [Candidatus Omnitrophica bacterium]|nr:CDP-alcohol phosphatidyltransferase family protein [Candidatus Omnitrophota bacterium]
MNSLAELEHRCQKPGYRMRGNWMARRIARPAALRVTRRVLPLRVNAHFVTVVATLTGLAAAAAFGQGRAGWIMAGAALLQLWYLLDHVDGQVARYWATASLSGVYLDYLMHYVVHAACPFGLAWGIFSATGEPTWILAGAAWSMGMILQGLANDCRYKAFFQRLKKLEGRHIVQGGTGRAAPEARGIESYGFLRRLAHLGQKASEIHVIMNVLTGVALATLVWPAIGQPLLCGMVAGMAVLAPAVAVARVARSVSSRKAEQEFATWFPDADTT